MHNADQLLTRIRELEAENAALRGSRDKSRNAEWFALVMGAAAAIEDAANCLRDNDAARVAESAAQHYRDKANDMWEQYRAAMKDQK